MFSFIHIGKKLNSYDLSALSTLSGLAIDGCLVGVVYHVAELNGRNGRQILIEKGRAYGSTVRLKC